MESFQDCFRAVSDYCRTQMSNTSHGLFIDPLQPYSMNKDVITLSISSDWLRNTVAERYTDLLEEGFSEILGFPVTVRILSLESLAAGHNSPLNQKLAALGDNNYTFDSFVVGAGNRFAHAAAQAVAANPSGAYNPLFIYGGSGLGKTHLMMAILNDLAVTHPEYNVVYVEGEQFTNELIQAIRDGSTEEFRSHYRVADVLLVDDIHFIGGKEQTMEEFFHTFNALHKVGKQIVMTSDRPPKDIKSLTDRLRTRFEMGLLADIMPPEYETRVSILKRKSELLGYPLPDDVAAYIADSLKDNIRQLEGIVKKLYAYSIIDNATPTVANAQAAIRDIMMEQRPLPVTVDKVIEEVARTFAVSEEDIRSKKRDAEIAQARQVSMYILRTVTGMTLEDIGNEFGRNHATVSHSIGKIQDQISTDSHLSMQIEDIIKNTRE